MPRLPESFLQELRYRCDIESIVSSYVQLKRRGRTLLGLCPFHSEKTPSFNVYPETQSYYCFGCGAGGDVITFVRQMENLGYVDAVKFLAQRVGMQMPEEGLEDPAGQLRQVILEINRASARYFHHLLVSPQGRPGLEYLTGRGLTVKTIKHFGLGYAGGEWDGLARHLKSLGYTESQMLAASVVAPRKNGGVYDLFRERAMFPIIDLRGNVIGFGGRTMGERGPKYLNSPDTAVFKKSRNLFALNFAKAAKEDKLILAEGYMDVIALHQAGFENAVATLGTSLTSEQSRLISQYASQVILSYDSDEAGQKATRRAIGLFDQVGLKVRVLQMTGAKDPDEYIKKFGAGRFKLLLDGADNAVEFELEKLRRKYDLETADGKVSFLKEAASLLAGIQSPVEREVYLGRVAQEMEIDKQALALQAEAVLKRKGAAQRKKEQSDLKNFMQLRPGEPQGMPRRGEQLTAAIAEERLIGLIYKNPDYAAGVRQRISPEDFTDEGCRRLYELLCQRLQAGDSLEVTALGQQLEEQDFSRLAGIIAASSGVHYTKQEAEDYIAVIQRASKIKTKEQLAGLPQEELRQYIQSLADRKK